MNKTRLTFVTGILFAAAFVVSCGGESSETPVDNNTCGGSPFEPSGKFCYAEQVFSKCGGEAYNPLDSFCVSNKIYGRCGGAEFNFNIEFCYENIIYRKCNNAEYNPQNYVCNNNALAARSKCNGMPYDSAVSFCDATAIPNKIYDLCNGKPYSPASEFCYYYDDGSEVLGKICGGMVFNPGSSFCDDFGNVYDKCNNAAYNPSTHFCYDNELFVRCNGREYNGKSLFCHDGKTYSLCGGRPYDPSFQLCRGNIVEAMIKCGSDYYDNSKDFCDNGTIHELCNAEPYNTSINFCYNDKLYPTCSQTGNPPYDPFQKGCFEGKLYPVCGADGILGICVHNTVLRCKQAGGSGEKYIVKPYPGMKCREEPGQLGKIVGEITVVNEITINGVVTYERRKYNTVQIGEQVWMAENLEFLANNYLSYWGNACAGCPNDENNTLTTISYSQRKGLCPNGWRVPSSKDWQELVSYVGGKTVAGNRLKSTSGWRSGSGLDNYGFNATPVRPNWFEGDISSPLSTLDAEGAIWWTSTSLQTPNVHMAKFWYVISSDTEAEELAYEKANFQFSVRCLQNIE